MLIAKWQHLYTFKYVVPWNKNHALLSLINIAEQFHISYIFYLYFKILDWTTLLFNWNFNYIHFAIFTKWMLCERKFQLIHFIWSFCFWFRRISVASCYYYYRFIIVVAIAVVNVSIGLLNEMKCKQIPESNSMKS